MRAVVIYESIFGNTRAVAEAIAHGIAAAWGEPVDAIEVANAPTSPGGFDLVVVGGPIHAWGMASAATRADAVAEARRDHQEPVSTGIGVREWLGRIVPSAEAPAAAAFDTAMDTRWFPVGSAAKGEARELARVGYRIVVPPEHFLVAGKQGPLVAGELERAQKWGQSLAELCTAH